MSCSYFSDGILIRESLIDDLLGITGGFLESSVDSESFDCNTRVEFNEFTLLFSLGLQNILAFDFSVLNFILVSCRKFDTTKLEEFDSMPSESEHLALKIL